MQPKLNTGGQALCNPDTRNTGGAEETSIRQLISHGKSKTALDRAKELHKSVGSATSEALLIDAYAARIQALLDQNLALEAKSLLELVRDRFPAAKARLEAVSATSAARAGALDELLEPLANSELKPESRAAIEQAVQNTVADLAAIACCPALPQDHDLRVAAAALDRAFAAAASGKVSDDQIALPEVSRRSPLAPWKLLVRAMAHFYRREDDLCRESLAAIKAESVPARLIPAMQAMLGSTPAKKLGPAETALVARTTEDFAPLRRDLEQLDSAFAQDADEGEIFKLVRQAMQKCRQIAPDRVDALKRITWVRGAGGDLDSERMVAALQGMPRQDANFFRMLAYRLESNGDPESLSQACELWDEFRQHAVRENWFGANGVEVATLYIHMAGLARKIPEDPFEPRRPKRKPPEDTYYLFPEMLYERACVLDPHPENFSKWLTWAAQQSAKQGEDVAKAWHKIRPMDIDPLLHLMQAAETRRAYPSALTYLEKAERIDAVHSVVRAARMRLLTGSALRHLEQKKPHLAEEKVKAMAALPQSRQGDRPAFLAALDYVIALHRDDDAAMARAQRETGRLLGNDIGAGLLALGIAAATKRRPIALPPPKELAEQDRLAMPALIARVVAIAEDLGVKQFKLPIEYMNEAIRQFPHVCSSLDTTQLQTLARAARAGGEFQFSYAVSGEGLRRGGSTEARFLLLRACSLPEWAGNRVSVCAAAVAQLARSQNDSELVGQAIDIVRHIFGPDPISLTLDQAREVVRKEIEASAYPLSYSDNPNYSSLAPGNSCDCPECRKERGEIPGPSGFVEDDDDDEDLDEEKMERIFNERVPPGLPPELAKMMFEIMKESYLNGIPPEEIFTELEKLERSGGKGKRGKRK